MSEVYITRSADFFPNDPINNDDMEEYLGYIKGKSSRSRKIVLRSNKIENRYYALDKQGNTTHTNHEMAAIAIRKLFENNDLNFKDVDILGCGTSSPDQMMPAHGYMVHGEIKEFEDTEVVSVQGNCCSSIQAMKYAYMAIKSDMAKNAVVSGSERVSKLLHSKSFEEEAEKLIELESAPVIAFEKDFLRWMLSDGGSAVLLQNKPSDNDISLKIDWIEVVSYAHEAETCMYMGGEKNESGELISFKEYDPQDVAEKSLFAMKQDVRLLDSNIVKLGFQKLADLLKNGTIKADEITYFVPHMSSFFFQDKIAEFFEQNNINMPLDKWFTNLSYKGNIGAASIFSMIAELMNSDKLKKGNKILLAVPESARFSYVFAQLTVC